MQRRLLLALAVLWAGCSDSTASPPSALAAKTTATIRIRAIPLDGWTLRDAFVLSRQSSGAVDSVPINASGLATLRVTAGSTLDLRVDAPAPRQYHPSSASYTVADDTTLEMVLVPTSWVVQRGPHAGSRRPIDIVNAFGSDNDDTHFLNLFTPSRKILVAWSEDALPISVGLDTTGTTRRWSSADSAWFWSALNDINDAMGRPVFRPTGGVAVSTRNVIGIRIDYDNPGYFGSLGATVDSCRLPIRVCNDLHGAVILARGIFYRSLFDEGNFRSMQHEMMHSLGFGHACYWSSVMTQTRVGCTATVPAHITVDDVAYIELIFRLASVLAAHPQAWNLDEALAGARSVIGEK